MLESNSSVITVESQESENEDSINRPPRRTKMITIEERYPVPPKRRGALGPTRPTRRCSSLGL